MVSKLLGVANLVACSEFGTNPSRSFGLFKGSTGQEKTTPTHNNYGSELGIFHLTIMCVFLPMYLHLFICLYMHIFRKSLSIGVKLLRIAFILKILKF